MAKKQSGLGKGLGALMMENSVEFDGMVGVSAGAAFGCNYKSRQPGRAIRYNKRFAHDRRYSGIWSLLTTGNYFNATFGYHVVPFSYDIFDQEAFNNNPMEFVVVCTDVNTGKAVYKRLDTVSYETLEWLRASASMPLASRIVSIGSQRLLDGGVSDSIPLEFFEHRGYSHNVVILTQPAGYQKKHNPLMPLLRLWLRKHPEMVRALDVRHTMYNSQLEYVAQAEREGRCLVIRPDSPIPIGHTSHDPQLMERVYQMGRKTAMQHISSITEFCKTYSQ